MNEAIKKYIEQGGTIKKIKPGFAIGYVPNLGTTEMCDLASDVFKVAVAVFDPRAGQVLHRMEAVKQKSAERQSQFKRSRVW